MPPSHVQLYDPAHLHATLLSVLRTDTQSPERDDGVNVQHLFEELMLSKQHLVKLFDAGPRSEQERREVEGGESFAHIILLCTRMLYSKHLVLQRQDG